MKLIVGLGNPGGKFEYTRHNIGYMVVEKFVKNKLSLFPSLKAWKKEEKFSSDICKLDADTLLAKPYTYMNLSGLAVVRLLNYYKINSSELWVVHDDIDLPLGKIRIRRGGASAGHHGIESIIKELGESNFVRFRMGIGRGKLDVVKSTDVNMHRRGIEKFVLSKFGRSEGGDMKNLIKKGSEALEITLKEGIEKAMNRFN